MPATRRSPDAEFAPEQRRDEIISILAAGLVRLIGADEATTDTTAGALARISGAASVSMSGDGLGSIAGDGTRGVPVDRPPSMPTNALPNMPAEKLSDSGEIGLELPRETRLSVVAG